MMMMMSILTSVCVVILFIVSIVCIIMLFIVTIICVMMKCFRRKGLHFLPMHARSLLPKMSELQLIMTNSEAAVISITETWLDDSVSDGEIRIDSVICRHRNRNGDVFMFILEMTLLLPLNQIFKETMMKTFLWNFYCLRRNL